MTDDAPLLLELSVYYVRYFFTVLATMNPRLPLMSLNGGRYPTTMKTQDEFRHVSVTEQTLHGKQT